MSTTKETRLLTLPPKRTRKNVKQSKDGCYTCRDQRKKCDEAKPSCFRCLRRGKICEGYARYTPPCRALSAGQQTDHAQSRFARLGFEVLVEQACRESFGIGAHVWMYLLPQLSAVNQTINAAMASFGAIYEAVVLQTDYQPGLSSNPATFHYHKALALLQADIYLQPQGPKPLFLASVLLAAVEVLLSHLTNALMHLRGAFTILTEFICQSGNSLPASPWAYRVDEGDQRFLDDENRSLHQIALALDVQTATYTLSRSPELPFSSLTRNPGALDIASGFLSPDQACSELLPLLHTCYHYTSLASEYKYLPRFDTPYHISRDQSRYIALLSQWLSRLDYYVSASVGQSIPGGRFASRDSSETLLLVPKIQCISTLIYLSTILSPNETAYDSFTSLFQQIVDGAAVLLEGQSPGTCLASSQNRFQLISPVSQPLYLTAMKCRQGAIRRQAIHLLSLTGREGPWVGALHVKVVQRALEIEEERVPPKVQALQDPSTRDTGSGEISVPEGLRLHTRDTVDAQGFGVINVPEDLRLHGCGISSETARLPGKGFVEAQFSRCVDVKHMVTRTDIPWDSEENWDIWTERISMQ